MTNAAYQPGFAGFNLADIVMQAQRAGSLRDARERGRWELEQAKAEAERVNNARASLANVILNQSPAMPGQQLPTSDPDALPSRQPLMDTPLTQEGEVVPQRNSWAEYVQYDPEGAIDFRASTSKWQKEQFELTERLNDGVLQILSGVYDQSSYEKGKNKARALYGRYGLRLDDLGLPDQFSPELVNQMRVEATATKDQLAELRRQRELDWNIEDDQIDNQRMADAEADRATDRSERRKETRRYHDSVDKRVRDRPQGGRGSTSRGAGYAPHTATGKNGEKYELRNGKWVQVN